jgi:hypothetical protein
MILTVARQGRAVRGPGSVGFTGSAQVDRSPNRCCPDSRLPAAMSRVVEQIQRLQGNELTVLITASGTAAVSPQASMWVRTAESMFLHTTATTAATSPTASSSTSPGRVHGATDQPGLVGGAARCF